MKRTLLAFIKKELAQTLRDKRMKMLLFVMPIVQMTVFGLALSTEIRGIKLASVFEPNDIHARRLTDKFLASGWFVASRAHELADPAGLIESGQADAVLVAPREGLTRALQRGKGQVQLLVDGSNATKARAIEAYALNILAKAAAAMAPGKPQKAPFLLDTRVLYNPSMQSSKFMVPGVMSMIVCLITIILTSMSLTREREMGTFETIVSAPLENIEILLGKTLPYILLGMADMAIVITAGFVIFDVPVKGPLWQIFAAALLFVITTVSIGTLISTISRTQQQAMLGGFIFLFPALLMSGIMYPIENMPKAMIIVAYLDPLKYFVTLIRNIMLKGGEPYVFWSNTGALALMAVITASIAYKRFRQTLN